MPSWLPALLGAPIVIAILGWVVKIVHDRATGQSAERRDLRREGAQVVTPARELVATQLGPEAIMLGSNEEVSARLQATHAKWWNNVRPPLLTYANQHPSERVRELTIELVDAVGTAMGATRYLFISHHTATTMDAFNDSTETKTAAVTKADELMDEIRGTRRSGAWSGRARRRRFWWARDRR